MLRAVASWVMLTSAFSAGQPFADVLASLRSSLAAATAWAELQQAALDQEAPSSSPRPSSPRAGGEPDSSTGGTLSVTVDGRTLELRDVERSAWFAPYVRRAAEAGIVGGYRDAAGNPTGLFGPGAGVTVAELAKLAALAAGIDPAGCPRSQNPLAEGAWFAAVLGCAEGRGWVLYSDKRVDPLRPAARGEVVITLLQAFGVTQSPVVGGGPFTDVTASTQYAPAIDRAKRDGIVRGYADQQGAPTGLFGPTDGVTRAEAAKILMLATDAYKR